MQQKYLQMCTRPIKTVSFLDTIPSVQNNLQLSKIQFFKKAT